MRLDLTQLYSAKALVTTRLHAHACVCVCMCVRERGGGRGRDGERERQRQRVRVRRFLSVLFSAVPDVFFLHCFLCFG